MPRVVSAGVPIRRPDACIGGRWSNGIALRLTVMPTSASRSSASLPLRPSMPRSTSTRCTSVPPVSTSRPPSWSASPNACAFAIVWRWRSRKTSLAAIRRQTALAAMMCSSGPPCWPGKTALSIAWAYSSLQRISPARGPQSVLCVVVVTTSACGTGLGCSPGRDEPGEVGHVDHQLRADLVGDPPELGEVEVARIGGPARDDHLRPVLLARAARPAPCRRGGPRAAPGSRRPCRACRTRSASCRA